MELRVEEQNELSEYMEQFAGLIGDARTHRTLEATVRGIIGSESLCCSCIAAATPELAVVPHGERRIRRLAHRESTKRSRLDEEHLIAQMRERAVARLGEEQEDIWVAWDTSDLRKEQAQAMEALMEVRSLDGKLVPGYRTFTALGMVPGKRGLLYRHLYSSEEKGFRSEPTEFRRGLRTVMAALAPLEVKVTHILDRGFDDRSLSSSALDGKKSNSWLAWVAGSPTPGGNQASNSSPAVCAAC